MKDLDYKITNEIIFPDKTINKEYFRILNIKKMKDYIDNPSNINEYENFLKDFYKKNISEYTKNDRNSIPGSFFYVFFI